MPDRPVRTQPQDPAVDTTGSRIRRRRKQLNLSLEELATRAELSKSFVWEVENDRSDINSERLFRLADALHLDVEYLVRGKTSAQDPPATLVQVPMALSETAEELGLSHRATLAVWDSHRAFMARRSTKPAEDMTKDAWRSLIESLRKDGYLTEG